MRIRYLAQPVRTDEAATFLYYAFQPLPVALSVYGSPNNHIFHSLLVHGIWSVFGDRPELLRLPAFLAGVLLIPATYALARRGRLFAAALVATLPILVDYSTIARGYTLMALCVLVSMIAGRRAATDGNRAAWTIVALAWAIGFWTMPTMLFGAGFAGVWLIGTRWRELALTTLGAAILTLLLYLPVLVVSGPSSLAANAYVRAQSASGPFDREHGLLAIARMFGEGFPLFVGLVLVAGLLLAKRLSIGIPLFIIPALLVLQTWPYRRTWLFLIPIAAIGLSWIDDRRVAVALAAALAVFNLAMNPVWYSPEAGSYRDAEGTTRFLAGKLRAGDVVVATVPSDVPLMYYFLRNHLSLAWFHDPQRSARCWIVVNPQGPSLKEMLAKNNIAPRSVRRERATDSGELFLAER